MRRTRVVLFLLASLACLPALAQQVEHSQPLLTFDNQGAGPAPGRLIVQTLSPVADYLDSLRNYGTIHMVIPRLNAVAMTPTGQNSRATIASLPFVVFVEDDQPRWLTDVGTWDRDILDVVDMEETGVVGDPDPREVAQTGAGVHVAVIDTGLIKRWRDFIPESKVRTDLATAFMGGGVIDSTDNVSNPENLWERDTSSHGTSVASHVVGFNFSGFAIDGVAPDAKIVPLKVFPNGEAFTFSSRITAAIEFVVERKLAGAIGLTAINMSLSGGAPSLLERAAIQDAIDNGIVVVASAGNAGENGMGWPGAFPEVISAGATGWTRQFQSPFANAFWILLDVGNDPDGRRSTLEADESFVTPFSSRAIPALSVPFGVEPQELDVLAPGALTVAPCLLPGAGGGDGNATFCFWFGTSFSSPLTAGVAALILEKYGSIGQAEVESILKSTALPLAANDSRAVPVPIGTTNPTMWDTTCVGGFECDPVGAGLVQADAALAGRRRP